MKYPYKHRYYPAGDAGHCDDGHEDAGDALHPAGLA